MKSPTVIVTCCIAVLLTATLIAVADQETATIDKNPTTGEQIKWQVVAGGGTTGGSSTNYRLSSTVGQTAAGSGASTNYKLIQGFQQNFSTAGYLCGDADGSGTITISDAVFLINYIFSGGPAPSPLVAGDADCSDSITISDAVYMINYIFGGGPAPCAACP